VNITYRILRHLPVSKKFEVKNAICLFADPRSGSTWLAEILSGGNATCLVNEPLSLENNPALKALGFSWRQCIPAEAEWPEAESHFTRMLNGSLLLPKSYSDNSLFGLALARKAVFKMIRGKLLVSWLCAQFDFRFPPIYLIRHPLAVVHSMSQHPSWQYAFTPFQVPQSPFSEIYTTHQTFLKTLKTNEEQLLAYWCLANLDLWHDAEFEKKIHLIRYEELVRNPMPKLSRLFTSIGEKVPSDLDRRIERLSSSSIQKTPKSKDALIHGWRDQIKEEHRTRYHEIIDHFNIDLAFFDQ